MNDNPIFENSHKALVYAFEYIHQASPGTPMKRLLNPSGGSGKGLFGVDGAGQSGMILAAVCRLPDDQHNVIVAKYSAFMHECKCCSQLAYSEDRLNAIEALTHCQELNGLNKKVSLSLVRNALLGGRLSADRLAREIEKTDRTIYRKNTKLKIKFGKLERMAKATLEQEFIANNLILS